MSPLNAPAEPRLLDQLRTQIRVRHYSLSTERTYAHWVKRYIYFHNKRHPRDMAENEINLSKSYQVLRCNCS